MKNNYFPLQFVMLGYLLIGIGIYFIAINNWVGYIMIPSGFIFAFLTIRQKLDLDKRKYRDYYCFFGLRFGKWKDIPNIDYVTVFRERMVQGKNVASISSSHSEESYKVDMIISREEKISATKYTSKEKALDKGMELARAFNCKLLDYTSGKAEWVRLDNNN